jgi:hypothetical protein
MTSDALGRPVQQEILAFADGYSADSMKSSARAESRMTPQLKALFNRAIKDLKIGKKRLDQKG